MKRRAALVVFFALCASACQLTLWGGSHELTIPPLPATPTPAPTPEAQT
jgi:hypothetical protein